MNVEEYYCGYFRMNGYKEFIKNVDDEYKLFVDAEHIYDVVEKIDVYDSTGKFYKTIKENERVTRKEVKEVKNKMSIVQMDYKFYILPIGETVTQDEIAGVSWLLDNSFNKSFKYGYHDLKKLQMIYNNFDYPALNKHKEEVFRCLTRPIEVNCIGNTFFVKSNSYKSMINLDIQNYIKESNIFIKTLEDINEDRLASEALLIFHSNIMYLSAFYMTTPKKIKSKKFNRVNHSIDRINYNINKKEKTNKL